MIALEILVWVENYKQISITSQSMLYNIASLGKK